jgi:hypothetical protein
MRSRTHSMPSDDASSTCNVTCFYTCSDSSTLFELQIGWLMSRRSLKELLFLCRVKKGTTGQCKSQTRIHLLSSVARRCHPFELLRMGGSDGSTFPSCQELFNVPKRTSTGCIALSHLAARRCPSKLSKFCYLAIMSLTVAHSPIQAPMRPSVARRR